MVLDYQWATSEFGQKILVVTLKHDKCGATGTIKFSHYPSGWHIVEDVVNTGPNDNLGGRNEYSLVVHCHCRFTGEEVFAGNKWLSTLPVKT
jgi:hypothetical protein